MIAVIFESVPLEGQLETYLSIAAELKKELVKIKGFISIERFQSMSESDKYLSLSFWENEESIREWRNFEMHREAQEKGRNSVFKTYRLRVATVIRDYGMNDRHDVPIDSKQRHN